MSKKVYEGKAVLEASRWGVEAPSWTKEQRQRIIARIDELIKENPEYLTSGNYLRIPDLFAALALYEMYLEEGKTKEEAISLIGEPMWEREEEKAKSFRRMMKFPGALKFAGTAMKIGGAHWNAPGWKYSFGETSSKRFEMTCYQCIYHDIYEKHGCLELGRIFCHADEINLGHLPGHTFTRNHTLCNDGEPCDFVITKDGKKK